MDFAEVFSRAWNIVWKHKILWLFGLFASCGQQGSSFNFRIDSSSFDFTSTQSSDFPELPPEAIGFFLAIMAAALVFAIIAYLLGVVGRLGIIQGVVGAEAGEEKLSFSELFNRSQPYFGRALLLNFLVLLAWIAVGFILFIVFFAVAFLTLGLGVLCLIPLMFCVVFPLSVFVSVVVEQANVALVLEDLSVMEAFKRGWIIVRDNIGSFIVLGLVLFVGGFILLAILAMPAFAIFIPLIMGLAEGSREAAIGTGIMSLLCLMIFLPVLLVVSGLVTAYVKSVWTLTFMRLASTSAPEIEAETK